MSDQSFGQRVMNLPEACYHLSALLQGRQRGIGSEHLYIFTVDLTLIMTHHLGRVEQT